MPKTPSQKETQSANLGRGVRVIPLGIQARSRALTMMSLLDETGNGTANVGACGPVMNLRPGAERFEQLERALHFGLCQEGFVVQVAKLDCLCRARFRAGGVVRD